MKERLVWRNWQVQVEKQGKKLEFRYVIVGFDSRNKL